MCFFTGMNLAFKEGKAEFTNLAKTDEVFISNAVHKAYIEVPLIHCF